uniref:Putative secreted protein n=1 Tax=Anopheles marajoara TaxID=58244 RepID=A0A2M4CA74_9DIPT
MMMMMMMLLMIMMGWSGRTNFYWTGASAPNEAFCSALQLGIKGFGKDCICSTKLLKHSERLQSSQNSRDDQRIKFNCVPASSIPDEIPT